MILLSTTSCSYNFFADSGVEGDEDKIGLTVSGGFLRWKDGGVVGLGLGFRLDVDFWLSSGFCLEKNAVIFCRSLINGDRPLLDLLFGAI